jgi:hypothetical protein
LVEKFIRVPAQRVEGGVVLILIPGVTEGSTTILIESRAAVLVTQGREEAIVTVTTSPLERL